jgi:hypothetical protein
MVVILIIGFFVYRSFVPKQAIVHQKCPEYYAEDEVGKAEYKNAMISWTEEFFAAHPEATVSDWSIAKAKLWAYNNCVIAMQRLKMSGKVEDLKPYELVDIAMQNALSNAVDTSFYDANE